MRKAIIYFYVNQIVNISGLNLCAMKNRYSSKNEQPWAGLYKVAAIAAIIMVILIPVQGAIFAMWKPPGTVQDWFILFQTNKLMGLLDMDLLLCVDYLLLLVIFLALWAALKKVNLSFATIAFTLQLTAIAIYFASTAAFEMLRLSNLWANTTSYTEKIMYLAAGQAMYATWQGTAFNFSYLLGCIALFTISVVMLYSTAFSKTTAYLGLAAGVLMVVPPTAGLLGMTFSFISLVPTIPWLILLAKKFFKLSHIKTSKYTPVTIDV